MTRSREEDKFLKIIKTEDPTQLSGEITPVSYTHLDVYKRQLPIARALSLSVSLPAPVNQSIYTIVINYLTQIIKCVFVVNFFQLFVYTINIGIIGLFIRMHYDQSSEKHALKLKAFLSHSII